MGASNSSPVAKESSMDVPGQFFKHADNSNCSSYPPEYMPPSFSDKGSLPTSTAKKIDRKAPDTPGAFFRAANAMPPPKGKQVVKAAAVGKCTDQSTDVLRSRSNDSYEVVRVKSRDSDSFVYKSEDNPGKVLKMVQHPEFSEVIRQQSQDSRFIDPDSPETPGQFFRMASQEVVRQQSKDSIASNPEDRLQRVRSRDSYSSLTSRRTATSSKSVGSNASGKVVQSRNALGN